MANPMNEAFSQLLGALKQGDGKIPNKLKIGEQGPITPAQHTINQINAQDWTYTDDGALILNNPEKKDYYRMVVCRGSRTKTDNLLRDDINLFKTQESISRVNLMGEPRVGSQK